MIIFGNKIVPQYLGIQLEIYLSVYHGVNKILPDAVCDTSVNKMLLDAVCDTSGAVVSVQ